MIQIDGSERVVLRENVRDPVSMLSLHGGQCCGVVRPCTGISRAGVPFRLRRHERRLLPAPLRLLRPSPHRPLRPRDQRRQRARQFCQIGLMCARLRFGVAAHGAPFPHETAADRAARTAQSVAGVYSKPNLVVQIVGKGCRCRRWWRRWLSRSWLRCCLAVSGGLFRRRDAHPQAGTILPRNSSVVGNTNDDLSNPTTAGITKRAAECPVVCFVEWQAPLIVGEPDRRVSSPDRHRRRSALQLPP